MPNYHSLTVQYRVDGWGSVADLERRHRLQDLLDAALHADRNGGCDGGDIGSGSINIYLEKVIDPDRAAAKIVDVLRRDGELEGAVIALSLEGDEEHEASDYRVLWPPDYSGRFSEI